MPAGMPSSHGLSPIQSSVKRPTYEDHGLDALGKPVVKKPGSTTRCVLELKRWQPNFRKAVDSRLGERASRRLLALWPNPPRKALPGPLA